ncbi:MAG: anhydro-N-acetylmuramic acid kinase [Gammaproteobacteria bacterium]|nr:anhydro-N-acetylmuramic acid kinase [Gammaproteobacteria bacterium]
MPAPEYFIGLLSGTSIDGVDCVLVDFSQTPPYLVATHSHSVPASLRQNLLLLCQDQSISLRLLGETDIALGRLFAEAVNTLLAKSELKPADIIAIGSHGQTIQHHPQGSHQFTMQIGDPNTISAMTGITTIADFRRKDMAAGGQGAPLTPLFHQGYFGTGTASRAVLNIGGIANISLLSVDAETPLIGFDTGPGNVLMDSWINLKRGLPFDRNGAWAQSGTVESALLGRLMSEDFFALPAPKSTGRELFNLPWLTAILAEVGPIVDVDVQATLLEFTAQTIAQSTDWHSRKIEELIVCGGGAYNTALLHRLRALMAPVRVISSDEAGLAPDWVEGVAFAWMARKTWLGEAIDCRSVTGARHPCLLGGIYRSEADGQRQGPWSLSNRE